MTRPPAAPFQGPRLAITPAAAAIDPRLKGRDLQVLMLLGTYADTATGWCWRSQVKMARQLRCARSTLQASLDRLHAAGWIDRQPATGSDGSDAPHWYRVICDPSEAQMAELEAARAADDSAGEDGAAPPAALSAPLPTDRHPCRQAGTPAVPASAGGAGSGSAPSTTQGNDSSPPYPPRGEESDPRGEGEDYDDRAAAERAIEAGFRAFLAAWPDFEGEHPDRARRAWGQLADDERAAALAGIEPFHRARRRKGRTRDYAPTSYLRGRLWRSLKLDAPSDPAAARVPLPAFSRDWWVAWVGAVVAGNLQRARFMASYAQTGSPYGVPAAEAPTTVQAAAAVPVVVGSSEWRAWEAHFGSRGARLPRPDRADRVWMPARVPAEWPEAAEAGEVLDV